MKLSLNHIRRLGRQYNWAAEPAPDGIDSLAERIGAQLGAIEEVIDFGAKFHGVIIAKVVSCEDHPNADRLHICKIDDGGVIENVERDEQGYVQVVCGAPNVRQGLTVAWLPPGSTVPESANKDPFVLEARALRGVISNGMLASPRELTLSDSHEGILEIDGEVAPGSSFSEYYGLEGDVVFDIENKMFTHRPDCFGTMGVAREIAGIQQQAFSSPEWYRSDAAIPAIEADALGLEVRNELPELVTRFTAVAMSGIMVKPSPVWLQVELARHGLRPINNIVDLTNYHMIVTGQPLHAYDYDKVKALDGGDKATLVARYPNAGEKIALLNGKEIEPRQEAIVIASDRRLVGIGGVMGGADTEVDSSTKNIIIEAANFDMYSIRRTSMAHGLFTDAVTRFNKGQSPLQNRAVVAKMVDDVRTIAGGKVASELIDHNNLPMEVVKRNALHAQVEVAVEFINARLGFELSTQEISDLLTNVEFEVRIAADSLTVKAPFWRTDIEIPEDVVEEVGRLYGFDKLPLHLPARPMAPAVKTASLVIKQRVRDILSQAGANEVLNYSFVHGRLLERVGEDAQSAYKLSNALSPDLQYYRLTLTPSLLDKVHGNIKTGYGSFALFEIGKGHIVGQVDEAGLPLELERLALVFAADAKTAKQYDGAAYYQARIYLDTLLARLSARTAITLEPLATSDTHGVAGYYEPGRSAVIKAGDAVLGYIGEYRSPVRKALKLPDYAAGFEVDVHQLINMVGDPAYVPLSRFPKIEQDICLRVSADVPYSELHGQVADEVTKASPENCWFELSPVDIYQRPDEADYKQITLRLRIASYDKTLRDSEVAALLNTVAAAVGSQLQAERV